MAYIILSDDRSSLQLFISKNFATVISKVSITLLESHMTCKAIF